MPVVRYGESGSPLVYVPTSGGDQEEFGRYGLDLDLAPWIDSGRVQVFSVDGFGPKSFFDDALRPAERLASYERFERYAIDELLPWLASVAPDPRLAILGASYGAFAAANLFLRTGGRVHAACGLGGVYSMEHRLEGWDAPEAHLRMPLFHLGLPDERALASLRSTEGFHLFGAEDDLWLPSTYQFARALTERGIPHRLDIWAAPANHHERWWKQQARVFLERCHGS
jgi:esterase/lipase superfamily enzyme